MSFQHCQKLRKKCLQVRCGRYNYTTSVLSLRRDEFSLPRGRVGNQNLPTAARGGEESLQGSHRKGGGLNLLKISAPLSVIRTFRTSPVLVKYTSLDSTFKQQKQRSRKVTRCAVGKCVPNCQHLYQVVGKLPGLSMDERQDRLRIQIRLWIRSLLFSSVVFKMSTKYKFFAVYFLKDIYISLER